MQRIGPVMFVGFGVLLFTTAMLFAAGPGQADALVPYQGHLDRNGTPLTGTASLRVGLYPANTPALADCLDDAALSAGCGTWSDEFPSVPVLQGVFSIVLGSLRALPAGLFSTMGTTFLGVAVREGDSPDWVRLEGFQQLLSSPYAVRADGAEDFGAQRDVAVGRDLDVTGTIRGRGAVQVDGTLTVTGPTTLSSVNGDVTFSGNITTGSVSGFVTSRASRQTDQDNSVNSSYDVSRTRYFIEANYDPAFPSANTCSRRVRLDDARLTQLCGDDDGCMIRVGMKNWSTTLFNSTSLGPFHFNLGPADAQGDRPWRLSQSAMADDGNASTRASVQGEDADDIPVEILRDHSCVFTDVALTPGSVFPTSGGEAGVGFALLNYNHNTNDRPLCWMIIDD